MHLTRPLRSAAFRLALVFASVFALAIAGVFAAATLGLQRYIVRSTATALADEEALLRSEASLRGRPGVQQLIARRERLAGARQFLYLLVDPNGRRLIGELPPSAARLGLTSARVRLEDDGESGLDTITTLGVRLSDGSTLIVGRDADDAENLSEWVSRLLAWTGLGVVAAALGAGYWAAVVFVHRLDRIGLAADRVMSGGSSERLPQIGMGEEFDRLSATLNRMLDRLEAAMDSLRQVSTDIAHDLRTPLTRLRQTLEQARGHARSPEQVQASIEHALAQTEEVLATFGALLRIGMIEGGAGRSRFTEVDVAALMGRVAEAYGASAEDAQKTLALQLSATTPVLGDEALLTQLFANLVENALQHTPPGARITLAVATGRDGVVASVADDGPGIPSEETSKVLTRFYRLDRSRTTPGAGLGLAMVSAIAELHGVTPELLDNRPGLAVVLRFPRVGECHGEIDPLLQRILPAREIYVGRARGGNAHPRHNSKRGLRSPPDSRYGWMRNGGHVSWSRRR